ncbi:hypothetical protein CRUP_015796 [Coryphaenoides rupestris]|nr:hypothetical protein CRUP_015796 [Coryphaenoides rupestris]
MPVITVTAGEQWHSKLVPGREGLEVVVGHVQHAEVGVSREQRDTLVRQPVVGEVQFLEDAVALL